MSNAIVTDIQRFSVHDGPGIRTTVFLKGCPLRCEWCHNPECISFESENMFYPEKCIGCGKCTEGCYSGARVKCGKMMSTDDVMSEILLDRSYYGNDGGITVSGGEPLAHRDFTLELLVKCHEQRIGTAIESSMYRFDPEILMLLDLLMADIKIFDSELHRRYTGMPNDDILLNIRKADELGIPMIIRTPIIPSVNDTPENIKATSDFLRSLKHVQKYELLPYHPLGISKARALGKEMKEFLIPTKQQMEELSIYADIHR